MKAIESNAVLRAVDVSMRFGAAVALDRVSLSLPAGSIGGLIGPNGAGKSTLFNLLAGDFRPSTGEIYLNGRRIDRQPSHTRAGQGLGRTFQLPRPFAAMTVLENVMLGAAAHAGERVLPNLFARRAVRQREAALAARARELIEFVTLERLARSPAAVLSGGQLKLLELARVLMGEPRVILLDEPAAGVHPALLEVIAERIETLNRRGVSFLIVEHNMSLVGRLCAHLWVLSAGTLLCQGTPAAVWQDPQVRTAYLGLRQPDP